jgi:hypothetical protein
MSIMDQRDWGSCVDIKVGTNPGPIIAGVLTPVITIGAAAAVFMARGRIQGKLLPESGTANPDRKMWTTIKLAFVVMILACISNGAAMWSTTTTGFSAGPWLLCPPGNPCTSSTVSGFVPAITATRFFVMTGCLATIWAFLAPLLVHYRKLERTVAAKSQVVAFLYAGVADFIAFMIWTSIFTVAANAGWALYLDIVVFALCFAGAIVSMIWLNHIAAAPEQTPAAIQTSGPIIPSKGYTAPAAYPTSQPTKSADAAPRGVKATPVAAASTLTYTKKWGQWEEMWDEENQAYYFFNHSNGDSAWERPTGWPSV